MLALHQSVKPDRKGLGRDLRQNEAGDSINVRQLEKLGQHSQLSRPDIDHQIRRFAGEFHEKAATSFDSLRAQIVAYCVLDASDHYTPVTARHIRKPARGALNYDH